jgi:hypothetical protein
MPIAVAAICTEPIAAQAACVSTGTGAGGDDWLALLQLPHHVADKQIAVTVLKMSSLRIGLCRETPGAADQRNAPAIWSGLYRRLDVRSTLGWRRYRTASGNQRSATND